MVTVAESIEAPAYRDIAAGFSADEARWLVDYYYAIQDYRIQASGQVRAVRQRSDEGAFEIGEWLAAETRRLENEIVRALDAYGDSQVVGRWAKSICGIGPVLAAGLMAHIDIEKAPTVGHIWRFAGLDPTMKWHGSSAARELVKGARTAEPTDWEALLWLCRALGWKPTSLLDVPPVSMTKAQGVYRDLGGDPDRAKEVEFHSDNLLLRLDNPAEGFSALYPDKIEWDAVTKRLARRPWNAKLKVLCWKIGDSFVKQQSRESDVYGKVYVERKEYEIARNESGGNADAAAQSLAERNIRDRELRTTLEDGKLPPGRLDLRARRYAVKLFLAHYHHVAYEDHYGKEPPRPYIIAHGGHTHFIAPPHWKNGEIVR